MQSLIKDLSADNVGKVSEQSAEKMCLRTFWLTELIPTAQVINNDATSMFLKH